MFVGYFIFGLILLYLISLHRNSKLVINLSSCSISKNDVDTIDKQSTNLINALTISTDKDQRPKTMEKYVAFRTAEKNVSTENAI